MQEAPPTTDRSRRPNYIYTLVSVALVLFLVGIFGLYLLQAAHLSQTIKEQLDIMVELVDETEDGDRSDLMARIANRAEVRENSVVFVSKEQGLADMGDDFQQDLEQLGLPNPLHDMLSFNVKADYLHPDSLGITAAALRADPLVLDVFYQENFVDEVAQQAGKLGWIMLSIAVLLIIICVVLIHNTVRLSLYANRFIIKTQQTVGATWGFISKPYLRRAIGHGLLSGLLAVLGLVALQSWLQQSTPELRLFDRPDWLVMLYVGLVVLGVLINYLSHYAVVRRYLRMRIDDLY
ncbi:MAG: permease-like cell division protein FtsX [Bacteroidota bacterium]